MTELLPKLSRLLSGLYDPSSDRSKRIPAPAHLREDPIAELTNWAPNQEGGSNFRTHSLVQVDDNRIEFKGTGCVLLIFGGCLLPLGLMVIAAGVIGVKMGIGEAALNDQLLNTGIGLFLVLLGILLTTAMIWALIRSRTRFVLDKQHGALWKGKHKLLAEHSRSGQDGDLTRVPLDQVYAVQIISEYVEPSRSLSSLLNTDEGTADVERDRARQSFYSHELNLVLRTGERITVTDHANDEILQQQAQTVATFLGVPLWNLNTKFHAAT